MDSNSRVSEANATSPGKNGSGISADPYGAAFSLASLEHGNSRSSLSMMNMNLNFDTGVFLKSGSFDSLHLLGSQYFKQQVQENTTTTNNSPPEIKQNSSNSNVQTQNVAESLPVPSNPVVKSLVPTSIPSNVIATSVPTPNSTSPPSQHFLAMQAYGNNALIQPKENEKRIVERKDENSKFVDVTPYLTLPQHEAAKKLGIPSSTLAKRWKEASCNRKWPYRTVSKLDKEILTLLKNVENAKAELSPSVEATLGLLLKKRQEELKTVLVRL